MLNIKHQCNTLKIKQVKYVFPKRIVNDAHFRINLQKMLNRSCASYQKENIQTQVYERPLSDMLSPILAA